MKLFEDPVLEELTAAIDETDTAALQAEAIALSLKDHKELFLASLKNELADGIKSEAKIDRLAKGSKQYEDHITATCLATTEAKSRRSKYIRLKVKLELLRSVMASERAKINAGIYHQGK